MSELPSGSVSNSRDAFGRVLATRGLYELPRGMEGRTNGPEWRKSEMTCLGSRTSLVARWGLPLVFVGWIGVSPAQAQDTVIPPDSDEWLYFEGVEEPPENWNTFDFDDSEWPEGQSGSGYGDGDDNTVLDMQNNYVSLYIRHFFDVDPDSVVVAQLGVDYDDGFVAYLNGVEIARASMPGTPGTPVPFDTLGISHNATGTPQWFTLSEEALAALDPNENVLAIQGHNTTLASSDFSLIPQLRIYTSVCPTAATCTRRASGGMYVRWTNPISPAPFDTVEIYRNGELIGSPTRPTLTSYRDEMPLCDEATYEVVAIIDGEPCSGDGVPSCTYTPEPDDVCGEGGGGFRRGDADDDGSVLITDAVAILNWLFRQGTPPTCLDAADSDDDGQTNLSDAVFVLGYLFRQGPPPPAPGPTDCGEDATEDGLGACAFTSC